MSSTNSNLEKPLHNDIHDDSQDTKIQFKSEKPQDSKATKLSSIGHLQDSFCSVYISNEKSGTVHSVADPQSRRESKVC